MKFDTSIQFGFTMTVIIWYYHTSCYSIFWPSRHRTEILELIEATKFKNSTLKEKKNIHLTFI